VEPICYSIPEAADALSLGETTVRELVLRGEIPSVTVGRRRLIPVERLREWVRLQSEQSNGG